MSGFDIDACCSRDFNRDFFADHSTTKRDHRECDDAVAGVRDVISCDFDHCDVDSNLDNSFRADAYRNGERDSKLIAACYLATIFDGDDNYDNYGYHKGAEGCPENCFDQAVCFDGLDSERVDGVPNYKRISRNTRGSSCHSPNRTIVS